MVSPKAMKLVADRKQMVIGAAKIIDINLSYQVLIMSFLLLNSTNLYYQAMCSNDCERYLINHNKAMPPQ
jgi:hypothetical protein